MIYDQSFNSRTETELTTELSLRKILTRLQLLDASTRELSTGTSDLNPSWQRTSKFGIFSQNYGDDNDYRNESLYVSAHAYKS